MYQLFAWAGAWAGFIYNGILFDARGEFIGYLEGLDVWGADGQYLGELVEGSYVLRRDTAMSRMPRMARMAPIPPMKASPQMPRMPKVPRVGYSDVLDRQPAEPQSPDAGNV